MPVVELAKLRVQHNQQHISQTLRGKLLCAKNVMAKASGYTFKYYASTDDLGVVFIVGTWPSVDFHLHEFIPGAPNQELLETLKDEIIVEWMFHVDMDPARIASSAEIHTIAINQNCAQDSVEQCMEATLATIKHELGSHTGNENFTEGGWKIDDGQDPRPPKHLFVFLLASKHLAQQSEAGIVGSAEHGREHRRGDVEIHHVRLVDVSHDANNKT